MLPDVVTSESWQEYHRKKALKKQEEAEAKKKHAEERMKKKQERELLQQEKKAKKDQKTKIPKTRAPKRPGTRKIPNSKKIKKKLAVSSSEEDNDWSASESSEAQPNPDSDVEESISRGIPVRQALPFTQMGDNSSHSTKSNSLANTYGVCRLDIVMSSPVESPSKSQDGDFNDEELDSACRSLLDTINSFQNGDQPQDGTENLLGIADKDVVSVAGENSNCKVFKVTTLLGDSFIGIPLVPIHRSSTTFKAKVEDSQLCFVKDVTDKLNPVLIGEDNDEERRYILPSSFK